MARSIHFFLNPWDFHDIGVEIVLDRLVELGATGVNLAFTNGGRSSVSPMNPFRTLYYGEEGAVYFQPEPASYNWTPMKPKASRETEDPEFVSFMIEQVRARKLSLWAWVQFALNPHLAREHPRTARVDPFGNPHPAQLSPSSRNFRHYCLGVAEDVVEKLDPDAVILDALGYLPWDAGLRDKECLFRLTPFQELLLGLDFSDGVASMARKFQVKADDLQGQVAAFLQQTLRDQPAKEALEQKLSADFIEEQFDGQLARYLVAREAAASLLFENVSRVVRGHKKAVAFPGQMEVLQCGLDPFRLRRSVDHCIFRPAENVGAIGEQVETLRKQMLPNCQFIARIDPGEYASADGLRTTVQNLAAAEVDGFAFYNFGLLRPHHLKWIEEVRDAL